MKNSAPFLKKFQFLLLMISFGALGPILREITLPVPVTVCLRAWFAAIAIFIFILFTHRTYKKDDIQLFLKPICLCGIMLAIDWIGLFSSYNYTTIATATVCYYIVPILVLIASPFVLNEKFTVRHAICTIIAFCGIILVSGAAEHGLPAFSELKGIFFAVIGAIAYAAIILLNKKYPKGDTYLRTAIQLSTAAIFTTPYILCTTDICALDYTLKNILLLIVLGVGLTAVTYILYFKLIITIPVRTVAIFSYADPVAAVIISIFFLGEPISFSGLIGSIMIIGAAIIAEYQP